MIALANLVSTHWAKALGATLFHSLWEGAVVAIALALALRMIRDARLRYAAACAAMLAILTGFACTLFILMPVRTATGALMAVGFPSAPPAGAGWLNGVSSKFYLTDALPWLTPFWFSGILIFHLRGLMSWFAARRLRSRGVCAAPAEWQQRLIVLRGRVAVSPPVVMLESCVAEMPVVIGWMRPAILLPVGLLTGMPIDQIEAILLHELAHIRRGDYLVNLIQTAVESFLFYHPAVWWISGVMRAERENCCDDVVVTASGDAYQYASALAALEQNRQNSHDAVLAATGGHLMKRIRRLLDPSMPGKGLLEAPRAVLTPVLSAVILVIAVALTLTAWQTPASAPASNSAQAPAWQQWLNEDAVYIITLPEREAFVKLTTDPEREAFVEQFWQRRNPFPDSPDNAFKDEHYRRIAYADRRFTSHTGTPGWKTDRGRIYITYGPPDEIDAHPAGDIDGKPYEEWTYRLLVGIGTNVKTRFVDTDLNGEYAMTKDPDR